MAEEGTEKYFVICLFAMRNRFLTEGGWVRHALEPAGFHKLTVLELEESVVLSYVDGDTRFPPAHRSVTCGERVVCLRSLSVSRTDLSN